MQTAWKILSIDGVRMDNQSPVQINGRFVSARDIGHPLKVEVCRLGSNEQGEFTVKVISARSGNGLEGGEIYLPEGTYAYLFKRTRRGVEWLLVKI